MIYAIRTLWFERKRYFPGLLAVAFSGMLIALQAGIMLGLVGVVSVPIEKSTADIWVAYPNTPACDLARPIPQYWIARLWSQPDIIAADEYIQGFTFWTTATGKNELVIVMGCNLDDESLGPIGALTKEQRQLLTEPGSVILDDNDRSRLEIDHVGQQGEVFGQRVRVVGFAHDMGSLAGPYVLTSLPTARMMLRLRDDQTTYLLGKVRRPEQAKAVVEELREFPTMAAFESDEFSLRSKVHWITQTKAGIAVAFVACLGLGVGASVTSQTLYSATVASIKELAVLRALGIPRWRMIIFVLQQALLVGIGGLFIGIPTAFGLALLARELGTKAVLPPWLLIGTGIITISMALLSGLIALRSLRLAEPASLLR